MKISSMINWLRLEGNLEAAASHSEMHRVHVDVARIFLESLCPICHLILLLHILIRITCYLSIDVREIRNAYVTIITGVYVIK
jgi:hypothetical protein